MIPNKRQAARMAERAMDAYDKHLAMIQKKILNNGKCCQKCKEFFELNFKQVFQPEDSLADDFLFTLSVLVSFSTSDLNSAPGGANGSKGISGLLRLAKEIKKEIKI